MKEELYTSIESEIDADKRVSVSEWDDGDGGVFLTIDVRGGYASLPLSKADAAKLVDAIQEILAQS